MNTQHSAEASSNPQGSPFLPSVSQSKSEVVERAHRLGCEQPWPLITRELPSAGRIQLIPGNESFADAFCAARFSPYGETGAPSEMLKTSVADFKARVANLWYSEFESKDGAVKLGYLRSGTLSRYGEKDPAVREAANNTSAAEVLEAAYAVLKKRVAQGEQPIPERLNLVSIDLQSQIATKGELVIETLTTNDQSKAVTSINGSRVVVRDQVVPVAVHPFILPTHEGSFSRQEGWHLGQETIGRLKNLATRTYEAIPAQLLPAILPVLEEVQGLLAKEAQGATNPAERFGLAARIVLLSSLAGDIVHFNCRSGKDRTGYLDVEVKFLAYQLSRRLEGLPVSGPGEKVLPEEKAAWAELLLQGGNHEIQALNTGFPGSKLDHGLLKERIGADLWDQFIGESRRTRI